MKLHQIVAIRKDRKSKLDSEITMFAQRKRRDWGFHSPDGWVHWYDWETRYAVNGYGKATG